MTGNVDVLRTVLWVQLEERARTDAGLQNLMAHVRSGMDRELALLLTVGGLANIVDRLSAAELDRRRRESGRPLIIADEFGVLTEAQWDDLARRKVGP